MASKLVVYWRPGCPWAAEVRDLLKNHSVEYEARDIAANGDCFKEMVAKTGQEKSPCLEYDGDMVADAGASEAEEFLLKKGLIGKGGSGSSAGKSCRL